MKKKIKSLLLASGMVVSLVLSTTGCSPKTESTEANGQKSTPTISEDSSVTDIDENIKEEKEETSATENPLGNVTFTTKTVENYGDDVTKARYIEVIGLKDATVQEKLNQAVKEFCLWPTSLADQDTIYNIEPAFVVVDNDILSLRTYNTAYTTGAAYPVSSIRTQTFSLSTGEMDIIFLWDFVNDSAELKQLVLDKKFNFSVAGLDGKIPEEIKTLGYEKLAKSMDTPEVGAQFYFDDDGCLMIWCEGENHATGDYWLFDIPVTDLTDIASDRLLSIIEGMKNLGTHNH